MSNATWSLLSHSLLTAVGWDHQVSHHILPTEPLLRVLPGGLDFRQKANPPRVSTPFAPVLSACETTQEPYIVRDFCFCFMIYLLMAESSFLGLHCCVWAFSSCCGLLTSFSAQASHCNDFFCFRAQALGHTCFSSCGMRAQKLRPPGSRAQLWFMGLVTLPHVGSSWTRD